MWADLCTCVQLRPGAGFRHHAAFQVPRHAPCIAAWPGEGAAVAGQQRRMRHSLTLGLNLRNTRWQQVSSMQARFLQRKLLTSTLATSTLAGGGILRWRRGHCPVRHARVAGLHHGVGQGQDTSWTLLRPSHLPWQAGEYTVHFEMLARLQMSQNVRARPFWTSYPVHCAASYSRQWALAWWCPPCSSCKKLGWARTKVKTAQPA